MNPAPTLTVEDAKAIFLNLFDTTCVCGSTKKARQSFCRRDYFRLPPGTRQALYEREGYPECFAAACKTLGLAAPAAADLTTKGTKNTKETQ